MVTPKEHFHGSDLETIEKTYGIKKEEITSFSANVNPLGISFQLKQCLASHIDAITTYPDREYTSLRNCIGNYVSADPDKILVGNGSTELISLFIQYTMPRKTLILGPTYSEYEREVTLDGGSLSYFPLEEANDFSLDLSRLKETLTADIDLFVLCNPNNPTGTLVSQEDLKQILSHCKQNHTYVMVDETYIEFAPDTNASSSIPLTEQYDNLIVLRGVSKFFASPGLRLGYAVCGNRSLLSLINEKKNPWTINTLAAIAGEIMFTDSEYIDKTKNFITSERDRIQKELSIIKNIHAYPTRSNFILCKILKTDYTAHNLFEAAIKEGLMIRDCSTFRYLDERFFRFCFMSKEKNDQLLAVIRHFLG